jgi:tungstate transport system permease protein
MSVPPATTPTSPTGPQHVLRGLSQGLHLIFSGNSVVIDTTLRTLHLACVATLIGIVIGVPLGAAIGLGRSRGSRVARGVANGLMRIPPVVSGLVVLVALTQASRYGGGPLAGLHWETTDNAAYLAQTLLAVPIMVALTAVAVQGVSPGLLEQARAFGAPGHKRGALAIREARRRMLAAVLVTVGVTITSIGAIAVSNAPLQEQVGGAAQPPTLALGAFEAFTQSGGAGSDTTAPGTGLSTPTPALGVAYATLLMGLFVLIAAALTWMQQTRAQWIPGLLS